MRTLFSLATDLLATEHTPYELKSRLFADAFRRAATERMELDVGIKVRAIASRQSGDPDVITVTLLLEDKSLVTANIFAVDDRMEVSPSHVVDMSGCIMSNIPFGTLPTPKDARQCPRVVLSPLLNEFNGPPQLRRFKATLGFDSLVAS